MPHQGALVYLPTHFDYLPILSSSIDWHRPLAMHHCLGRHTTSDFAATLAFAFAIGTSQSLLDSERRGRAGHSRRQFALAQSRSIATKKFQLNSTLLKPQIFGYSELGYLPF